jgi:hypothetical protein
MASEDEIIPSQKRLENVADDADLEEVYDTPFAVRGVYPST